MPAIPLQVLKDKGTKLGDFHSWWLAANPKDGEQWAHHERISGYKISEGNRRDEDGKYRSGSAFLSIKFRTTTDVGSNAIVFRKDNYPAYKGRFGFLNNSWRYDYSYMSMHGKTSEQITSDMFVYGSEAFSKLRPDMPDFSPLLSLIELLREAPSYAGAFKDFNKRYHKELRRKRAAGVVLSRAGKYHLAIQFGIMPIISDFISYLDAMIGADARAKQLIRDNGKWVRRRARLYSQGHRPDSPVSVGWSTTHPDPWNPNMLPNVNAGCYVAGTKAVTSNTYRKSVEVWAVGKSKYYLPSIPSTRDDLNKLKKRIARNMEFSPDLVYNLIPWSWLFDYFTSLGHLMTALSGGLSNGNVVFQYAYVMRTEHHLDKSTAKQRVYTSKTGHSEVTCSITREGIQKGRIEASLFGFGITNEDLNPQQWAILGALGLSKI